MTISYEQALTGWILICLALIVIITIVAIKLSAKERFKKSNLVYITGCFVVISLLVFGVLFFKNPSIYRYDEIDFENSGNTYNLVYEIQRINETNTDRVKVIYLDKQFNIHETEMDLRDSIIGTTVCSIGLDGKYTTYLDLGPLRIEKQQTRDLLVLNKYWAIQLGLLEPTGSEDEKPFDFGGLEEIIEATPSDATEGAK